MIGSAKIEAPMTVTRNTPGRNEHADVLIVFTRFPRAGEVKTRLIPALGAEGAARLHRRMAEFAVGQARRLARHRVTRLQIHFAEGSEAEWNHWLGSDLHYTAQVPGDLGTRMNAAFTTAFAEGASSVIIMGSDCPGLTATILAQAFDTLLEYDLVLGPASDGGYYLIGLQRLTAELFQDIPWGTDQVLARTLDLAKQHGITHDLLPERDDVDRPEDLVKARAFLAEELTPETLRGKDRP
jgi:rSAM/selenodomain-associated transferase 1